LSIILSALPGAEDDHRRGVIPVPHTGSGPTLLYGQKAAVRCSGGRSIRHPDIPART
jgi:hypothetical protein